MNSKLIELKAGKCACINNGDKRQLNDTFYPLKLDANKKYYWYENGFIKARDAYYPHNLPAYPVSDFLKDDSDEPEDEEVGGMAYINAIKDMRNAKNDELFKWGDEVEVMFKFQWIKAKYIGTCHSNLKEHITETSGNHIIKTSNIRRHVNNHTFTLSEAKEIIAQAKGIDKNKIEII